MECSYTSAVNGIRRGFYRRCTLIHIWTSFFTVSGTETNLKYVCPGGSVQAFSNIDFDRCNTYIYLDKIGDESKWIAMFAITNCTVNGQFLPEYQDRVSFHLNGTMTIHKIQYADQGLYTVISKKYTLPSVQEVRIEVMVAPKNDCKPMIKRLGNHLYASLKPADCGHPVVTPHWKNYDDVSISNETLLNIAPGNEIRTYYACIEGPVLQCMGCLMPHDYCSSYSIEGDASTNKSSESSDMHLFLIYMCVIQTILAILMTLILFVILQFIKRNNLQKLKAVYQSQNVRKRESGYVSDHETSVNLTERSPSSYLSPDKYRRATMKLNTI